MRIAYNPITEAALTTAPDNNDITFDLKGLNIFVKGVKFKGTDTTYQVFKKHTSSSGGGYNGLVPVPSYTSTNDRFLREDGTWQILSSQYTYSQLTNQDLDTLKTEGKWYYLGGDNTVTNGPSNINSGGELYVGRNANGYRYQKVILIDGVIWFRIWNGTQWADWKRWYTDANTDSKVLQSNTTTANYRPIILGYNNNTDHNNISSSVTQQVYTTTSIYAQPSTGSLWAQKLYSGGKEVLTSHQSLSDYVTISTTQTITGQKTFSKPVTANKFIGPLQGNADTATKLQTARTLWGKSFDGTKNVSGDLNYVGNINFTLKGRLVSNDSLELSYKNNDTTSLTFTGTVFRPFTVAHNNIDLGASTARWRDLYIGRNAYVNGNVLSNGFIKSGSSDSYVLLGGGGHKAISDFMLKSDEINNNVTTITKTLNVTSSWMDTGIAGNNLETGTYIIQLLVNDSTSFWSTYHSGIMSWYKDNTNDSETDEIILHRAGHAYSKAIYLRTVLTTNGNGGMKLQIAASSGIGAEHTYIFKFKRVI